MFHGGETDGRTDMTKVIISFRKLSNSSFRVTVKLLSSYSQVRFLSFVVSRIKTVVTFDFSLWLHVRCDRLVVRASSNVCISCLLMPQGTFLKRRLMKVLNSNSVYKVTP